MPNLLLITSIDEEAAILQLALKSRNFSVSHLNPPVTSPLQCLLFKPDIILMEIGQSYLLQCSIIQAMSNEKRSRHIPILAFGRGADNPTVFRSITQSGAREFFPRPLKISDVSRLLEAHLPKLKGEDKPLPVPVDQDQDMARILGDDLSTVQKLDLMVSHVGKLMAFPFTAAAVTRVADDPMSGAAKLSQVISQDQAISATILKISNSVFCAGRGKPTTDIREAVVRIGFSATRNIALSLSVLNLLDDRGKQAGFDRSDLWYQSLACGLIAEKLARNVGYPSPSEAFIAGLLHDFGALLLDEFFGDIFTQVMVRSSSGHPALNCEKELLGFDHNDLVDKLFEQWRIPANLGFAIKHRATFLEVDTRANPSQGQLTRLLGTSSLLAKAAHLGRCCDAFLHPVPVTVLKELKIELGLHRTFMNDIYPLMDQYCSLLSMEKRIAAKPLAGRAVQFGLCDLVKSSFEPHLFYMHMRGYGVTELGAAETTEENLDMLVLNVDKQGSDDTFLKLMYSGDNPGAFKPLLVFAEAKEYRPSLPEGARFEVLPKNIDTRTIDAGIEKLLAV